MSVTSTYTVKGMTCGHCTGAVSSEISKLPAVTNVDVDLPTGEVRVVSETPVDAGSVRAAVEEAGYEVVA